MLALGIIEVIAGVLVMRQAFMLSMFSQLASSLETMTGAFGGVGICMIVAGILAIINNSKREKKYATIAGVLSIVAAVFCIACMYGDLQIWLVVNIILAIVYFRARKKYDY